MGNNYKILIIEDDDAIQRELDVLLKSQGYESFCYDLKESIENTMTRINPHLILLDLNLPSTDGFTICQQVRCISDTPIIVVTSRSSDVDELCSITIGADDFITKPYHSGVLLARMQALLKRTYEHKNMILEHHNLGLDIVQCKMLFHGKSVELTKNEFKILHCLFLHRGQIVSREDMIDYLWDNKLFIDDNALSVNINRIRSKMRDLGVEEDYIKTRHRLGYQI